jgi:uracil-DNA glycosylase family 4
MLRVRALALLEEEITRCRACPRLVRWREEVARVKRRRYAGDAYWGRPVPAFGDPRARIVILGLAPGAHGANRTGRMFTGDRSGDFLFAALHRAGLANRPESVWRDDGLRLTGVFITATIRCVPPANKPGPDEVARCAPFLDRELALLPQRRVVLALGAIAWAAWLAHVTRQAVVLPRPVPRFAHGAELYLPNVTPALGSYHVSQQNTQTGKLTPRMFDAILARARALAEA